MHKLTLCAAIEASSNAGTDDLAALLLLWSHKPLE
jgi:hypothetical protein